jgi:hypothetical protein
MASLTLPTREENAKLSAEILFELAAKAAVTKDISRDRVAQEVGPRIEDVARLDTLDAAAVRWQLLYSENAPHDIRLALSEDPTFRWASELFEANCAVGLSVEPGQERQMVKLSYDESQLDLRSHSWLSARGFGWQGYMLWLELPLVTSGSYHFEVIAPEGLEIIDCGVALDTGGATLFKRGLVLRERTHVYLRGAHSYRSALGWSLFRVYRGGFITGAIASGAVVVLALGAGAVFTEDIAKVPGGVPALLLLFPSALVALVARPGRHEIALRLVHHARWLLAGVAMIAFLVAARVAVLPGEKEGVIGVSISTLRWEFVGATILTFGALIALLFSWLLPRAWKSQPAQGVYIEPVVGSGLARRPAGFWSRTRAYVETHVPWRHRRSLVAGELPIRPAPRGTADESSEGKS